MYSDNFLSSPAARCIKSTLSVSGNHNVKRSVFLSIPQTEKIPAPPIRRAGCEAPRPEKGEGDSRGEEERLCMSGGALEVFSQSFNVPDAGVLRLLAGDLLDCPLRHTRPGRDRRPMPFGGFQLEQHELI